ncbi:MAG TPA: hypothetical protein PK794_09225, partial [Armatimonadota bacterium]|nr:hypothetical protein [Armatimonadota bacterium]
SRALRMIPAMVDIARDVQELAPEALFFNYGNPMGPVCRGVRKATGAAMVGLCHGVNDVAGFLARELGVPRERLRYTAAGMNHLTWFTEVRVDGRDAMPRLREIAQEKLARLSGHAALGARFTEAGSAERGETPPEELLPFTWQLLLRFGGFPAVLDRHVTEFFPALFRDGSYYGKRLGVDAYSFEGTIKWGDEIYAQMRELALSNDPLPEDYFGKAGGEHEQVIDIIDSIRTDAGRVYSANLPNRGQIPNLPPEAIVESPCVADAAGLRPIALPPLPSGIAGTLTGRLAWVETTVEAALEGSRDKFIQALINDGAVSALDTAVQLADDLLAEHARYLPQFAQVAS